MKEREREVIIVTPRMMVIFPFCFSFNCFSWYCSGTRLSFHLHKYMHSYKRSTNMYVYIPFNSFPLLQFIYSRDFQKTEGFFKGGTFSTAAAVCREATILKRAFNIIVITSQTTSSIILPYLLTTPCFLLDNSNRFSTTRQKSSSNIQV